MFDVLIVGCGVAGLFASSNLHTTNALALDHASEPLKKLLISGGGMCNLTNTLPVQEFLKRYGNKQQRNFLLPALQTFPPDALMHYCSQHGVPLVTRDDGKVFPQSLDAQTVYAMLLRESKARILLETSVHSITNTAGYFVVETSRGTFETRKLVLATGGMSYPRTGSDGSGYALAKSLGHTIVPPRPALSAIKIEEHPFAHLSGNSLRSVVCEFFHAEGEKRYRVEQGDILFTHDGLSGPCILRSSREIERGDILQISLLPCTSPEELEQRLRILFLGQSKRQVFSLLKEQGMFSALAVTLLEKLHLERDCNLSNLDKKSRNTMINLLCRFPIRVSTVKGFSQAMVTCGGVSLDEVDRKSMQSLIVPNLFFCGEILDYDGDSGGFNIQAAFSTAYLASQSIHCKP